MSTIYRVTLHNGRTFLAEGENVFGAVSAAGYGSGIWDSVQQPVEIVCDTARLAAAEKDREVFFADLLDTKTRMTATEARLAAAEALLLRCRGLIDAMDTYLEQLMPRTDGLGGPHPALDDIDTFLQELEGEKNE